METTNNKRSELADNFFTLHEQGENYVLKKNGQFCQCPYRSPQLMPGKIHGTAELQVPTCSNACQFFNIITHFGTDKLSDEKPLTEVYLTCSGGVSFLIQNESNELLKL